jgi:hypothetical protein
MKKDENSTLSLRVKGIRRRMKETKRRNKNISETWRR